MFPGIWSLTPRFQSATPARAIFVRPTSVHGCVVAVGDAGRRQDSSATSPSASPHVRSASPAVRVMLLERRLRRRCDRVTGVPGGQRNRRSPRWSGRSRRTAVARRPTARDRILRDERAGDMTDRERSCRRSRVRSRLFISVSGRANMARMSLSSSRCRAGRRARSGRRPAGGSRRAMIAMFRPRAMAMPLCRTCQSRYASLRG